MITVILTTDTPGHRHCLKRTNLWHLFWPLPPNEIQLFDRIITLGVPILGPEYLSCGPEWLNLHGGNPEHYRGLDSHWWSIYHNDWANIVTTLHWIDVGIDTGDICLQSAVPLREDLYESNMEVCANLINMAAHAEWLPRRKQASKGRYYGAMPEELKEVCRDKLRRKIEQGQHCDIPVPRSTQGWCRVEGSEL